MIMETQVIELEKKYWQGMENHDYEMVKKLTRFPCIITHWCSSATSTYLN
jgi:hypothetical protein